MSEPKRRAPAFQFYADDFLAGTLELSQSDVGAYIRLLCHQWNRGSIPVETEKQQRLAGGSVSDDVLVKFRLQPDGRLVNERLEQERQKQSDYRELQRQKGLLSAENRKKQPKVNRGSTEPTTGTQPNGQPEGNSPSPSPSPYINEPPPHSAREVESSAGLMFPNLDDVKMFGSMQNIPEEFCEKFWLHYESTCWVDRNGNRITSWQAKLRGLWIKEQADIAKGRNGNKPPGGERKEIPEKIQIRKAVFSGNE